MTAEEYAALQAAIVAAMISQLMQLASILQLPTPLTIYDWSQFLDLLFPIVDSAHVQSAALGRQFYDDQRAENFPNEPRHDQLLESYDRDWFEEALTPELEQFLSEGLSDDVLTRLALRASKEVENAGRRQVMHAVQSDSPKIVQGWARVATGRETCEFCLTMISRGPVYTSAVGAGLDLADTPAQELWERGDQKAMQALMHRWHPGCDCLVVPVFDRRNWPGRDEYIKASEIWRVHSKLVDENPELQSPKNGNQHGTDFEWSRSEAVMASIRRALYNREIDMRDFGISTRSWRSAA